MSFGRIRLKTPEEVELAKKREQLGRAAQHLAEWERVYASLRSEIRMFEQVYEQILGKRISELEDLEWQLNGFLGIDLGGGAATSESEEAFAQFHHRTDLLDDDVEPSPTAPHKSLKGLYREVAKAIHPDLAPDDEERLRRQELMSVANQAYQDGDRRVLEDILSEWEQVSEPVSDMDVALELVRVIRQIARTQESTVAVKRQVEELKATDIYHFKLRVDEALADGIDLMAEMAAKVELDIAKTRKRLAALMGDCAAANDTAGPPLDTRLIRFPDYPCGILYERSSGSVDYRDWHRLGVARGTREVFLDKALRLDVQGRGEMGLSFLDLLQPDDLQALFLHEVDDAAFQHIVRLTGLQEIYLSNSRVSDEGLRLLTDLQGLTRLYIYHTPITDTGLLNLVPLQRLKGLTCSGTAISQEGLTVFRRALPGCKAVSFEWRHGKQL